MCASLFHTQHNSPLTMCVADMLVHPTLCKGGPHGIQQQAMYGAATQYPTSPTPSYPLRKSPSVFMCDKCHEACTSFDDLQVHMLTAHHEETAVAMAIEQEAKEKEMELREREEGGAISSLPPVGEKEEDKAATTMMQISDQPTAAVVSPSSSSSSLQQVDVVNIVDQQPPSAAAAAVRKCLVCGKEDSAEHKLRLCQPCKAKGRKVAYCSRTCQAKDWIEGHTNICGQDLPSSSSSTNTTTTSSTGE